MRGQRPPRLAGEEENGSRLHGSGLGILACAAAILQRKKNKLEARGGGLQPTVQGTCRLLWSSVILGLFLPSRPMG